MALCGVLVTSVMFAALFALGGAGIYGSPFASVPPGWVDSGRIQEEQRLMLLTILAGPVACLAALAVHRRRPHVAGVVLIGGVIAGAFLGTLTKFDAVWEKVFLFFVWLPMAVVALALWSPNSTRG
jgi:hypothetical protein